MNLREHGEGAVSRRCRATQEAELTAVDASGEEQIGQDGVQGRRRVIERTRKRSVERRVAKESEAFGGVSCAVQNDPTAALIGREDPEVGV